MAFAAPFAIPLAIAGTVVSGAMQYRQAAMQSAIARNNQKAAMANAEGASTAAQIKQMRSDYEYAGLLGEQEAAQGASGLDVLGATQMRTRGWTGKVRGTAAEDIRREGENQSAQFLGDVQNYGLQARTAKLEGIVALANTAASVGSLASSSGKGSLAGKARSTRVR